MIDLGAPFQAQGGSANFNCRTVTLSSMQLGTSGGEFSGTVIADGLITVLQNLNFYAGSLQGTSQARSAEPLCLSLSRSLARPLTTTCCVAQDVDERRCSAA